MIRALIKWLDSCANDENSSAAADFRETAGVLASFESYEFKEIVAYFESCRTQFDIMIDRLQEPIEWDLVILSEDLSGLKASELKMLTEKVNVEDSIHNYLSRQSLRSEPPRFKPALALQEVLDGFHPFFAATSGKLLQRFQRSLTYAGENGGLRNYLESNGHRGANSLIGMVRQVEAHKLGEQLPKPMEIALKKATVAQLKQVALRLGLEQAGSKTSLIREIIHYLTGDSIKSETNVDTTRARELLANIRKAATQGCEERELKKRFAEFERLSPAEIIGLGQEYRFAEDSPRKLIKQFWSSIEIVWAQALRN